MSEQPKSMFEQVVERMIAIRDQRSAAQKAFDDADALLKEQYAKGEGWLMQQLQAAGVDSMKCTAGTVFTKSDLRVSVGDGAALNQHILDTGAIELLERRVSKTAVKDYMEANNGELPPGVQARTERVVQLRRS